MGPPESLPLGTSTPSRNVASGPTTVTYPNAVTLALDTTALLMASWLRKASSGEAPPESTPRGIASASSHLA